MEVWSKEEEESVERILAPVLTKRRDRIKFLPSWYSLKPIAGVELGAKGRVGGLGVGRREKGFGLKRWETLRGDISRGRMALT